MWHVIHENSKSVTCTAIFIKEQCIFSCFCVWFSNYNILETLRKIKIHVRINISTRNPYDMYCDDVIGSVQ